MPGQEAVTELHFDGYVVRGAVVLRSGNPNSPRVEERDRLVRARVEQPEGSGDRSALVWPCEAENKQTVGSKSRLGGGSARLMAGWWSMTATSLAIASDLAVSGTKARKARLD